MATAQKHQVQLFLELFKQCALCNFRFIDRKKSLEAIAIAGLTINEVKSEILSLTYEDYMNGPTSHTKDGDYWEFGKFINGTEYFMRIKAKANIKLAICQSFHPAEKPIKYHFKKGG